MKTFINVRMLSIVVAAAFVAVAAVPAVATIGTETFDADFSAWTLDPEANNASQNGGTSSSGIPGSQFYTTTPIGPDNTQGDLRMDFRAVSGGLGANLIFPGATLNPPVGHPWGGGIRQWTEDGRWVSFYYEPDVGPGEYISGVDFDARFANNGFDSRLVAELYGDRITRTPEQSDGVRPKGGAGPGGPGDKLLFNLPGDGVMNTHSLSFTQAQDVQMLHFVWRQQGPSWDFPPTSSEAIYGKPGLFSATSDDWDMQIDNVQISIAPEPVTMALLGLGGLFAARRRRRA